VSTGPVRDDLSPTTESESILESALDDLEAIGILQPSNWMSISELLNPDTETHNIFKATDEDIFQSVMNAHAVQEKGGTLDE
jgi:hypothetical protein